jgi:hypothetical protein
MLSVRWRETLQSNFLFHHKKHHSIPRHLSCGFTPLFISENFVVHANSVKSIENPYYPFYHVFYQLKIHLRKGAWKWESICCLGSGWVDEFLITTFFLVYALTFPLFKFMYRNSHFSWNWKALKFAREESTHLPEYPFCWNRGIGHGFIHAFCSGNHDYS